MAPRRTPVPVTSAPPVSAEAALVAPDIVPPPTAAAPAEPEKPATSRARVSAKTTRPAAAKAAAAAVAKPARRNRTVFLNDDVWERARAAAAYLGLYGDPDDDVPSNLAELVEYALNSAVDDLEIRVHKGQPFPVARNVPRGPGRAGKARISAAKTAAAKADGDEEGDE